MEHLRVGSAELVVVRLASGSSAQVALDVLSVVEARGQLQVLDVLLVGVAADGSISLTEVVDDVQLDLARIGLSHPGLTAEADVAELALSLAPGTSALIALVAPLWYRVLEEELVGVEAAVVRTHPVPREHINFLVDHFGELG